MLHITDTIDTGWTELLLSRWLDGKLYQPDIRQEALLEFLRRTVTHLIRQRGYVLETLARGRFLL